MKITIVVGDWSGDGHSQSDTYVVESNLDKPSIERAYRIATRQLGFDLIKDVCEAYEENKIAEEVYEKLVENGINIDGLAKEDELDCDYYGMTPDIWLKLYLDVVKLGNPELQYSILNDHNEELHIGGYGLYQ